jgi:hypothetical protein
MRPLRTMSRLISANGSYGAGVRSDVRWGVIGEGDYQWLLGASPFGGAPKLVDNIAN